MAGGGIRPPVEPVETLARYYGEGETILIRQYPNGQYYVQYCYDDQDDTVYATAGGFDTFEQAEAALYTHRPQAKKTPSPPRTSRTGRPRNIGPATSIL